MLLSDETPSVAHFAVTAIAATTSDVRKYPHAFAMGSRKGRGYASYMNLMRRILRKRQTTEHRHKIGPHDIYLPPGHRLAEYQRKYSRYDVALGEIARIVFQRFRPALGAIDIGANIGDSAALINKYLPIPTLCVEGLPEFLPTLEKNCGVLGSHVHIETSFIGTGADEISQGVMSVGGTFSPVADLGGRGGYATKTLREVLELHPEFEDAKLLKIDTDGFDFRILRQSIDVISEMQPVIFFEYDVCFERDGEEQARQAIHRLRDVGYERFLVYDNFGNFLMSLEDGAKLDELSLYLLSNYYHGRGVFYLDVCAFPGTDQGAAIYQDVLRFERAQKETYLAKLRS